MARSSAPLLALTGVEKRFGGVRALRGANLVIERPGVVHALVGENGSGKSTLLGVLSGQLRPDGGSVAIDGEEVSFSSTVDALRCGIAMVTQDTALAPHLSVAENILMGRRLVRRPAGIDWGETQKRAAEILARLGLDYDPSAPVERIRPDARQMVEIARALSMEARVLILDESTRWLTDDWVAALFRTIEQLKSQGVATILVSHRLSEVFAIADELTVLRDGETVGSGPAGDWDTHSLVAAMVGNEREREPGATRSRLEPTHRPVALEVDGLTAPGLFEDVRLKVHEGEVVGLAGLAGCGRSELLEAIFGMRHASAGRTTVRGEPLPGWHPRVSIRHGIGFLPPDRKTQGLVLSMSVSGNLNMVATILRSRLRPPDRQEETGTVHRAVSSMRIKTSSPRAPAASLSGGNQQKVALGKWLASGSRVLLLDEPTRGVDVAAKAEIHQLLRDAADRGIALLVSSSENEELLELCDRILVMFRGQIVASLSSHEATEAGLARYAGGHS